MIYFNSRYLSEKLDINLAKWKRWAREFLPPDPLGGLRSGYARHFNLKDAFRVFLGGQLVGNLRYSIPETQRILDELDGLLEPLGFFDLYPGHPPIRTDHQWLCIYTTVRDEFEFVIAASPAPARNSKSRYGCMLSLTAIYNEFITRLDSTSQ